METFCKYFKANLKDSKYSTDSIHSKNTPIFHNSKDSTNPANATILKVSKDFYGI